MNKNRKVLLTGSTGFLGSHLKWTLLKGGYNVVEYKGDLRKPIQVKRALNLSNPDIVYHLGALVDLSRSYRAASKCIDINIKGTLNLLEAIRDLSVKRFIYTSTEEVYGENILPYVEEQPPRPPSPYAISKIAAEQFIWQYGKELGFSTFIFRIGTTYGPGQYGNTRLIPSIIEKALSNEDIPLNSGRKKRDYIYIDDVIDALVRAIGAKNVSSYEVINLGGGKQYSLKELVEMILSITSSSSRPLYGSYPDRVLEANEWLLDIKKAQQMLKWSPRVTLIEGLRKTIEMHMNQNTSLKRGKV